jgi:hypothetical protein
MLYIHGKTIEAFDEADIFWIDDTRNSSQCPFIILCYTIVLWLDIFNYLFIYTEDGTQTQILFINTH